MTLPRQKERQRREDETQDNINNVQQDQPVQVISNEQLMHLKLDKMQTGIDAILKLCEDTTE